MMLADRDPEADNDTVDIMANPHPFLYAQLLGIYHTNIIYVGPGMLDYNPRQLQFLWVRWYQQPEIQENCNTTGRDTYCLVQLSFPPMAGEDAFGFVDPGDVLRSELFTLTHQFLQDS
jgi:hypothetical protein